MKKVGFRLKSQRLLPLLSKNCLVSTQNKTVTAKKLKKEVCYYLLDDIYHVYRVALDRHQGQANALNPQHIPQSVGQALWLW